MDSQFTIREQIIEVVNKLFVYTDNQEWTKLQEEVFATHVELDMASMGAKRSELVSSREVCYRSEKVFEGLDAIHHQAGNYLVKIDGDKAEVTCNEMRSYGFHKATMQLIKEDQKWQILQYDWQP